MLNTTWVVVAAVGVSAAVGLLTGAGWPGFVVGAVLAVSLWAMLMFGIPTNFTARSVPAWQFAAAALAAVVVGYVIFRLGGENPAMWAAGFIVAGAGAAAVAAARCDRTTDS